MAESSWHDMPNCLCKIYNKVAYVRLLTLQIIVEARARLESLENLKRKLILEVSTVRNNDDDLQAGERRHDVTVSCS